MCKNGLGQVMMCKNGSGQVMMGKNRLRKDHNE